MDNTNHTTEHRKGQHLSLKERHEIEVLLKLGWTVYRIAKYLGRPYNTIKNEIKRGTVSLSNGEQKRYSAEEGERVYKENRRNCRRINRCLKAARFLMFVVSKFQSDEKWSLDAAFGAALKSGKFRRDEMVCTKTLYNYVALGLLPIKNINECHNRMLRRFIPKGKSISDYTADEICFFADCINGLPRKILGYCTPEELFETQLDRLYAV